MNPTETRVPQNPPERLDQAKEFFGITETDPSLEEVMKVIHTLRAVGYAAGGNGNYQRTLVVRVLATGKPLEQFTVAEVLALSAEHGRWFNEIWWPAYGA